MAMSLISPDDSFSVVALLLVAVAVGVVGEHKRWFGVIPGVLITILVTAIFASLNLLPSGSDTTISVPVYDFAFTYLIPFSIPLLLFNVQLKKVFRESGRLMVIFLIGALGVTIGALLAAWVLDFGDETYKLAGVYTATYTGGSVNFMAVADTFDFLKSPLFAASIVVDNVFTMLFIMGLFLLPGIKYLQRYYPSVDRQGDEVTKPVAIEGDSLLITLAQALMISAVLVALGMWLAPILESWLQTDLSLDVLLITIFILVAANIIPDYLQRLEQVAFQFGMWLLYFFLAVIGATCDVGALLGSSSKVLAFASITLFFHLGIVLLFGKWLKFSLEEVAIASSANVGGVSIAAPMAATFELKKAVTPAILIGIMGYVVGTFLGIGVGLLLK